MERYDAIVEDLLKKPYWVVDILPDQVPADSKGGYSAVEAYYRQKENLAALHTRFLDLLLKLNCYEVFLVWNAKNDVWTSNPDPSILRELLLGEEAYYIVILMEEPETMLTVDGGDLYMTLYNPQAEMLGRIRALAACEGLFVRKGTDS